MTQENEKKPTDLPEGNGHGTPDETAEQGGAASAAIQKAADAVRRAEDELRKAKQLYQKVRCEAAERLRAARQTTLGDLIDGAVNLVKKYPGPGVIAAVVIGFFLGRSLRR